MPLKRIASFSAAFFVVASFAQGCGARSQLQPCRVDADCTSLDLCATYQCAYDVQIHDLACTVVAKTNCDDGDPCTNDACDKHTGQCAHEHVSLDLDGDGHYQPLPGKDPGSPGSCGDDCDDTDPRAYLGAKEVCDGVDNDCDGVIDNGATYTATLGSEFQLSKPGFDWAEPDAFRRGAAKGSIGLLASYDASLSGQLTPFMQPLDPTGKPATDPFILTGTDAAGSGTAIVWTGDRYGVSWSDRRDGNFEIYFALLDASAKKMSPGDERITVSNGFSIYPSLVWTGQEFVVVWQEEKSTGDFKLQGQRIDLDGHLIGNIATLTSGNADDQGPALANGKNELGLVWVHRTQTAQSISFQTFGFDLAGLSSAPQPVTLSTPGMTAADPSIAYDRKNDRYVVSFYDAAPTKRAVFGAVAKGGAVVVPATDIAHTPAQARDPALVAFGDRVLFVYADDRDQNGGYELYAHTLSADLSSELAAPVRVTQAAGDSIAPILSFSADGSVLAIFRDDRGPNPAVFETSLKCVMP